MGKKSDKKWDEFFARLEALGCKRVTFEEAMGASSLFIGSGTGIFVEKPKSKPLPEPPTPPPDDAD